MKEFAVDTYNSPLNKAYSNTRFKLKIFISYHRFINQETLYLKIGVFHEIRIYNPGIKEIFKKS